MVFEWRRIHRKGQLEKVEWEKFEWFRKLVENASMVSFENEITVKIVNYFKAQCFDLYIFIFTLKYHFIPVNEHVFMKHLLCSEFSGKKEKTR